MKEGQPKIERDEQLKKFIKKDEYFLPASDVKALDLLKKNLKIITKNLS